MRKTRNTIKYTNEEEIRICQKYLNFESTQKICKEFEFGAPKLYAILKKHNIQIHGHKKIDSDVIDNLIKLVDDKENRISVVDACEKLGISQSTASNYFKKRCHEFLDPSALNRKYTINNNYFQSIDSHDKAQILGLIMADGTMSKVNKLISIRLKYDDEEYLDKIKNIIGSNKPLYFVEGSHFISPLNKKKYLGAKTVVLDITNHIVYKDLIKCGVLPRKTWLNLGIPGIEILPQKFKKSFILGYFEGDGCITWTSKKNSNSFSLSFAGSKKMSDDIYNTINKELNIKGNLHKHSGSFIYVLSYQRIKDIIKILNWMYSESTFNMKRKYEKKEILFQLFRTKGYDTSINQRIVG